MANGKSLIVGHWCILSWGFSAEGASIPDQYSSSLFALSIDEVHCLGTLGLIVDKAICSSPNSTPQDIPFAILYEESNPFGVEKVERSLWLCSTLVLDSDTISGCVLSWPRGIMRAEAAKGESMKGNCESVEHNATSFSLNLLNGCLWRFARYLKMFTTSDFLPHDTSAEQGGLPTMREHFAHLQFPPNRHSMLESFSRVLWVANPYTGSQLAQHTVQH
ncbi:hypothetical protein DMENIID0001_104110 [Sergentomyia squamirostris]